MKTQVMYAYLWSYVIKKYENLILQNIKKLRLMLWSCTSISKSNTWILNKKYNENLMIFFKNFL